MDIATILGILVSFGLICTALIFGDGNFSWDNIPWSNLLAFISPASLLIVLGGTFGAMLTNYPLKVAVRVWAMIRKTLIISLPPTSRIVENFLDYAQVARRQGLLALEPIIQEIQDPYLRKGMQLMLDGMEPEVISNIMGTEIDNTESRHEVGVDLLSSLAAYAPALGLIGTVIGLVQMLTKMNDPSAIGPAMAVALLTTFYGAVLANLVFLPLCGKLRHRSAEESRIMEMQLAGVLGIARGENPRIIRETLECFQSPSERQGNPRG